MKTPLPKTCPMKKNLMMTNYESIEEKETAV